MQSRNIILPLLGIKTLIERLTQTRNTIPKENGQVFEILERENLVFKSWGK